MVFTDPKEGKKEAGKLKNYFILKPDVICIKFFFTRDRKKDKLNFFSDKKIGQNPNMNDPEQVYQLVKSYLDTNKKLSELADQIVVEETKLYDDTRQMKQLAEDFKKQAHDALLK